MARIRTIKPEFYISESLAEVSIYAERTFGGLITQVDDAGRFRHNAAILHGAIWALRPEHTPADVEDDLVQLEEAGLVCCYSVNDKNYLHLITFGIHQKISHATPSKLPPCPLHDYVPPPEVAPKDNGEIPKDDGKTPKGSDSGSSAPGSPESNDRLIQVKEIPAQGSLSFDADEHAGQGSNGENPEDHGELPIGSGSGSGSGSGINPCSPEVSAGAPKSIKRTAKQSDFEAFWKPWPRKVGKIKAQAAFVSAVKAGTDPAAIIAASASYAERHQRAGTPKDKIPHPTTWLNRGSWDDDLDDAVPLPEGAAPTPQPPRYGQPAPAEAADCSWCDRGWYERADGRQDRCTHPDTPPAGHPAAQATNAGV